jgi:hypothetical protein
MRTFRIATAFIAGIWLYYAAVVFTGGVLAAVAAPRGYFAFFGRDHNELALAVLLLLGWAIPVAVLVTGGVLALSRLLAHGGQSVWKPALAGMVLAFLYWALVSVGFFSTLEQPQIGIAQALHVTFTVPWYAVANFLAPWAGFALAVWLMLRAQRQPSPGGA